MYGVSRGKLTIDGTEVDFVKSPNVGGKMKPQFLVIHFTASGPGSDIAAYFSKSVAKVSAHLVIRRDGTIKQCVPFDTVGWHAGKSQWRDKSGTMHVGLNQDSIGIEIENWGPLTRSGSGWRSWTNQSVDPAHVIEAAHKNDGMVRGWETFTTSQVEATIGAAQAICSTYKIEEIVGHDDIAPLRKTDPGPAWNMASFRAKVFGRADNGPDTMVVSSPTGLNVRKGPAASFDLIRPQPLPDGSLVVVHEASGNWRYVSALDNKGVPLFSGWVNGSFLRDT